MKKVIKWILIITGSTIAISVITVIWAIWSICKTPIVELTPEAYVNAKQIWSDQSEKQEVELDIDGVLVKIYVSHIPTYGTNIQYPDERNQREIFPHEGYFGATEIKFNDVSGMIYVKVVGANALTGSPHGERIFEYDAKKRESVRDYWVHVSE